MLLSPRSKKRTLGEGKLPGFSTSKINISLIIVIHEPLVLTSPGFLLKMQNSGFTSVSLNENSRGKGPGFYISVILPMNLGTCKV